METIGRRDHGGDQDAVVQSVGGLAVEKERQPLEARSGRDEGLADVETVHDLAGSDLFGPVDVDWHGFLRRFEAPVGG